MVSPRLRKHATDIAYLQKAKPCIRKAQEFGRVFCEIAKNILRGNVQLTPQQKARLKKRKSGVLTKKTIPLKQKKAVLQKGGFLGFLLAPMALVVVPILSKLMQ